MKKYILGLAVLAGGLFASCDTDNIGPKYDVYTQNISFLSEADNVLTPQTETEVAVKLTRFGSNGSYTVHYTGSTETEGIFTDQNNGEVTFADGQSVAYITIKAANMERGNTYDYELTLSETDVATADTIIGSPISTFVVSVTCDYTWVKFSEGIFDSPAILEGTKKLTIYRAEEDKNLFKLPELYEDGCDVQIQILADGTVIVPYQKAWVYPDYGDVYVGGNVNDDFYTENESDVAGTYNSETGVITLTLAHYLAPIKYDLGTYTDTFTPSK